MTEQTGEYFEPEYWEIASLSVALIKKKKRRLPSAIKVFKIGWTCYLVDEFYKKNHVL